MVRVVLERGVRPSRVAIGIDVLRAPSPPAEVRHHDVLDSCALQPSPQGGRVELWIRARSGEVPDVDERRDLPRLEREQQLVEAAIRVSDRVEPLALHRR
jgi:hypothetical protein